MGDLEIKVVSLTSEEKEEEVSKHLESCSGQNKADATEYEFQDSNTPFPDFCVQGPVQGLLIVIAKKRLVE